MAPAPLLAPHGYGPPGHGSSGYGSPGYGVHAYNPMGGHPGPFYALGARPRADGQDVVYDSHAVGETLVDLVPCEKCGRTFARDRIGRHQEACQAMRRRKKFNTRKQRLDGDSCPQRRVVGQGMCQST